MENTFWTPECSKCVHYLECRLQHLYCDGIRYKEIDYLQTFKDFIKKVDDLYADTIEEITYEEEKTIEHIEDLLKEKEE